MSFDVDTLRKQLEAQEEDNRRLKLRFQLENQQLKDHLAILSEELHQLYSRIRQQNSNRPSRVLPNTCDSTSSSVNLSPRSSSPCGKLSEDKSIQCDLLVTSAETPDSSVRAPSIVHSPKNNDRAHIETPSESTKGLVASPFVSRTHSSYADDSDVPTLSREADRLLSVITRLRTERGPARPAGV